MPIAIWNPGLLTGHPTVDAQHKHLFDMVNRLHHAIVTGQGMQILGGLLQDLANYTLNHFKVEESLMSTTHYPGMQRHKALHDALAVRVQELLTQYQEGRLERPGPVSQFLTDWLNHHIREEDITLVAWLKAREE